MFASVASAVADKAKRLSGAKSTGKATALNTAQTVAPVAPESTAPPAAAPAAASTSSAALASLLSQVQSSPVLKLAQKCQKESHEVAGRWVFVLVTIPAMGTWTVLLRRQRR